MLFAFLLLCLFLQALPAAAKPPYQVLCYALQNTMAPAGSLSDTGQGAAINWTTDVPWNDLTMVADAFLEPKANDTFTNQGAKGSALINAAHAQNERCIVSLGGAGQDGGFPTLCASAASRTAFATAVTTMVAADGYDGVDIDWETTGAASQANATAMMQALYTAIKALPNCSVDGKAHTLAFTTNPSYSAIFNMTTLGSYTDWCLFMGYDWYDTPATYANGPLNGVSPSCVSSITGMTNGSQWSYPISKMILGCPLYTNDYNAGIEIDTLSILHLGTAGAYNTSYAEQAYTANGNTDYVDTAQSYCDKINWAIHAGLMGIGMWDMGQGLPYTDSTMTNIWNTIGGNSACLTVVGATNTPTVTFTNTVVHTATPSATFTNTASKTATSTFTNTIATTATFTNTASKTATMTFTNTTVNTSTTTNTASKTATYTVTSTATLTFTNTVPHTPTSTMTNTASKTATNTSTATVSMTFTNTVAHTNTPTITNSPTNTASATVTNTGTLPPTNSPTITDTPTNTATLTSTYTLTATTTNTPSMTMTNTPIATSTFSNTPVITSTFTLTPVLTATFTNTLMSTSTATSTYTASFTHTNTAVDTATSSFTPTATATNSFTSTNTSTFTATPSFTATHTPVNTSTGTWTVTSTYTSSPTPVLAGCPGVPVWSGTQVAYTQGQEIGYNGELYVCLQGHTSLPGLTPPTQSSLWKDMGPCGSTPTATSGHGNPVVYPNPCTGSTATIKLPISDAANVKVQIFTLAFREVQTVKVAQMSGDTLSITLVDKSGHQLADGLYYFVIQINGNRWVDKVLVLR